MDTAWSNTTRVLVILLIAGIAVWLTVVAWPLVQAIAIAALLAYLLDPAVRLLMRRTKMSRASASALVFILTMLIIVGIPAAVGTVAFNWFSRLGTDFITAAGEIERWLFKPIVFMGFRLEPHDMLDTLQSFGTDILAALPGGSLDILSSVTTNLVWALAVLVMFYYLLRDGRDIKPWLINLVPAAQRPEIERLVDEVNMVWGKFLRLQLLMFLLLTVLMVAGTLLIVGLFRFGLLRWSLLGFIVLLLLLYTGLQQFDNLWLRPHILGRQMRLHPGLVFVSLVGALMLSGLLGALLVVPLLGTVKVVGRYVHRKLLKLPPWPADDVVHTEESAAESEIEQQETDTELVYRL